MDAHQPEVRIRAGFLRGLPHGILEAEPGATYAPVLLRDAVAWPGEAASGVGRLVLPPLSKEVVGLPSRPKLPGADAGR
jgi:hypothetical protein